LINPEIYKNLNAFKNFLFGVASCATHLIAQQSTHSRHAHTEKKHAEWYLNQIGVAVNKVQILCSCRRNMKNNLETPQISGSMTATANCKLRVLKKKKIHMQMQILVHKGKGGRDSFSDSDSGAAINKSEMPSNRCRDGK